MYRTFEKKSQKTKKHVNSTVKEDKKTVTGIKMGTFVKKNKLNNSSKYFTLGQKIRS